MLPASTTCLNPQQVSDYLRRRLKDADRESIERHLDACALCRALVGRDDPTEATAHLLFDKSLFEEKPESTAAKPKVPKEQSKSAVAQADVLAALQNSMRFRIIKKLGEGGMGAAYSAEQLDLNRMVALKVIHPKEAKNKAEIDRLRRGTSAAAKLKHPNIVTTYHAFQEGEAFVIVMELIEGIDLQRLVERHAKRQRRLEVHKACELIRQAAAGLQKAHDMGMVHRDIKPSNLMTSPNGHVTVLDFDLARPAGVSDLNVTVVGEGLGTPNYMAPEQFEGAMDVDIRADIYSLGCTLFFLLTQRHVFLANSSHAIYFAHMREEPPRLETLRPDAPARLGELVAQMLAKRKEDRPATPADVARSLQPFTIPPAPEASSPSTPTPSGVFDWPTLPPSVTPSRPPSVFGQTTVPPAAPNPAALCDYLSRSGGKMLFLKGGRFLMGSPETEPERDADEKQHAVTVSPFYLGETPVTQGQFQKVMGYNPSYFARHARGKDGVAYGRIEPGGGAAQLPAGAEAVNFPVENVSWREANEFCDKLTELDGTRAAGWVYRLPREAEWEFACRAGTATAFHFGAALTDSAKQANFDGQHPYGGRAATAYQERTSAVDSYPANAFGLRDVHGNVWEWCADWFDKDHYERSADATDPPGPASGTARVQRGGCWASLGKFCRSANRHADDPARRDWWVGFRVALVPVSRG